MYIEYRREVDRMFNQDEEEKRSLDEWLCVQQKRKYEREDRIIIILGVSGMFLLLMSAIWFFIGRNA